MATHGQGGLRGVFIGSVTQKVLNQSKIPVLVLAIASGAALARPEISAS